MIVTTIAELLSLPPGTLPLATKGQIKKVGKVYSGTGQYGPWTIQQIDIMDATGKIACKFMGRAPLTPEWVGIWVYVEAGTDGKGRQSGLEVQSDEYKGKIILKVNEHAKLTQAGAGDAAAPAHAVQPPAPVQPPPVAPVAPLPAPQGPASVNSPAPPHTTSPAFQPRPQAPAPGSPADKAACIAKAKHRLGQAAVARQLAFDAAVHVCRAVEAKHGMVFTIAEVSAMATSFAIDLEKSDLIDCLPTSLPAEPKAPTGQPATPVAQ